jgi:type VI secretion system protein ImpH
MATEGRRTDPSLAQELFDEPWRFEFFQAVRVLERMYPERGPVGRDANTGREVVRFRTRQTLSFPATEIYELETFDSEDARPPELMVAFMGATGPVGVLPHQYTELLMERARYKDTALWSFLDIFNHRMISLFYRVWEKYHFPIAYERSGDDPFSAFLFDIIGMGTRGLQNRLPFKDQGLLLYSGLIAQRPHSASAISAILGDYFAAPAKVVQLTGVWLDLGDNVTKLGAENSELGMNTIAGTRVWSDQSKFRVRMGPLELKKFRAFMPVGAAYPSVCEFVRLLVGQEFEFDLQLVLKAGEVPSAMLNTTGDDGPRLGWNSWLKTNEFQKDDDQVVLSSLN